MIDNENAKGVIFEQLTKIGDSLPRNLILECGRLLSSGAVDFSDVKPDDFTYAKCVLAVALENVANFYAPIKTKSTASVLKKLREV